MVGFAWPSWLDNPFQHENRYERSIGEYVGVVGKRNFRCWSVDGPVQETWSGLGPRLIEHIEGQPTLNVGPARMAVEIYMVGRRRERARPTVMFFSPDANFRKRVRKYVRGSGFMNDYPGVKLGDAPEAPSVMRDLLHEIEGNILPYPSSESHPEVYSIPSTGIFGRPLYSMMVTGGSTRCATAGPTLYIDSQVYLLSAGHPFQDFGGVVGSGQDSQDLNEWDFESQNDSEDEPDRYDLPKPDPKRKGKGILGIENETTEHPMQKTAGASIPGTSDYGRPRKALVGPRSEGDSSTTPLAAPEPQPDREVILPKQVDCVGRLALVSGYGDDSPLDYALIELEGNYSPDSNEVSPPNSTQRRICIRQASPVGPRNTSIATVTSSSGFMKGILSATASFVRSEGRSRFQQLYRVSLQGKLQPGDSGSGVFDRITGHFYGHITSGTVMGGNAYIVPSIQVIEDALNRLGGAVMAFEPPQAATQPSGTKHWKSKPVIKVEELGSPKFFAQLKVQQSVDGGSSVDAEGHPLQMDLHQAEHDIDAGSESQAFSLSSWLQQSWGVSQRPKWTKFGVSSHRDGTTAVGNTSEDQLSIKLGDLRLLVVSFLTIPDLLNLRRVSRGWNALISEHEISITRNLEERRRIPRYALDLYPQPRDPGPKLHYICALRYRLSTAARLSGQITHWATSSLFLRRKRAEIEAFMPHMVLMRRRLTPLLFIVFHFLESCRDHLLKAASEDGSATLQAKQVYENIEHQIMDMYSDEALLQVHQAFPLLVSYVKQNLRAPSYYSPLEKPLRGYTAQEPDQDAQSLVLYGLGLREMVRLLEIKGFDQRVSTLNSYFSSLHRVSPSSHSKGRGSGETQKSAGRVIRTLLRKPEASIDSGKASKAKDAGDGQRTTALSRTSLSAGPPMPPLSESDAPRLLKFCPSLDEIWLPCARAALGRRGAIQSDQDIKKDSQILEELVRMQPTPMDDLVYGRVSPCSDRGGTAL